MSKKIILTIVIIGTIIIGIVIYQSFFKKEKPSFTLEKIVRGTVLQEVSETGIVKASDEIKLSFKNSGKIEKIDIKIGDKVEPGQSLAKLETNQLIIQFNEAKAALEVDQAQYNKLLAGSSPEEIKITETAVSNAKIALENATQNLKDVETKAQQDLEEAYEDAKNVLDDAYLKIYNAFNVVDLIQRTYFDKNDQADLTVKENKEKIENAMNEAKFYIDIVKETSKKEDTDLALSKVKEALSKVKEALKVIRETTETIAYRDVVSSTHKTSLDTQRTNINTALTDVTDSQQTISSTKITNEYNINTAKSQVSSAEGALLKAEDELALKKAGPRQEDIDLYQARVKQAQTKVTLLENQIQEATLKSPAKGQITKVNKRIGEMIQPTESIISLIPESPFQVKADIYEEDIVKVKVGNEVDITLPAFPEEILKGRVISIDPAEKLIEGVVYYEVTIDFEERKEDIKIGMTADIMIKTNSRENVLIVSKEALQKKNGKVMIQVFKAGQIEDREIEIGLRGSDGKVEVISGLDEGEEVIIR